MMAFHDGSAGVLQLLRQHHLQVAFVQSRCRKCKNRTQWSGGIDEAHAEVEGAGAGARAGGEGGGIPAIKG